MNTQAVPARDVVLQVCASADELDEGWLAAGDKVAVPLAGGFEAGLANAVARAAFTMGADRLLVCRTGSQFMYDSVEVLPAHGEELARLVAMWGESAGGVLVALRDLSAAVLYTGEGICLAAGPVPFVRELVGQDLAVARRRFGELVRREPGLEEIARRYGCVIEPEEGSARHERNAGAPRADTAERLMRGVARFRMRHEGASAGIGFLRTLLAWAGVVFLIVVFLSVPGSERIIGALFGLGWLLVQLCVLARSRTVTFSVLLRMAALGALAAVVAGGVELALAARQGMKLSNPATAVSLGGPVEELVKLLPIVVVWWFARRRFARLAAVDYLLLFAAAGAGFQLAEYSGLLLTWQGPLTGPGHPHFGFFSLLPGWIDEYGGVRLAGQAVLTGLVGACVGIAAVSRPRHGRKVWLLPLLGLVVVVFVHVCFDAAVMSQELSTAAGFFFALLGHGHLLRWLLLLGLVVCVLLDQRATALADDSVPPLPGAARGAGLQRLARGAAIGLRARVPREAAPVFHRLASTAAAVVTTAAETVVRIGHESALVLAAWRRGSPTLPATLQLLGQRRELAMAAYRARGRPRRDVPPADEVSELAETVSGWVLGRVAAFAIPVTAGLLLSHVVAAPTGAGGRPAFVAWYAAPLSDWLGRFTVAGQLMIFGGAATMLFLLTTTWSVPYPVARSHDSFLRDPRRTLFALTRDLGPGRLPFAFMRLTAPLIPSAVDRLLRPSPRSVPGEPAPHGGPTPPATAAIHVPAPAQPGDGADAARPPSVPDETWEFPEARLRRYLKHAPDFGVPVGTSFDAPALRAALLGFVMEPDLTRMDVAYHGRPARAVVDKAKGRTVVFTPAGEFLGCMLLTERQLARLLTEHQL